MFNVLDIALANARTLALRIVNQDCQGDIVAGATKVTYQRGGPYARMDQYIHLSESHAPILDQARAITDQVAPQQVHHGANQRGRGSAIPKPAMVANQDRFGAPAMANPYHARAGAPAIANLYSLESQRKIGNAIAMAGHAIGEGARALSERTSYEPKSPMFELDTQLANAFPETLHIGSGTSPGGHPQVENTREGQAGTETNTVSVRRPSDVSVKRPNTVFATAPVFAKPST